MSEVFRITLVVILLGFSLLSLHSRDDSYEVIRNSFHIGLWILVFCSISITLCFLIITSDIFVFRSQIIKNYLSELLTLTISKLQNYDFDENSKMGKIIKLTLSLLGDHSVETNRPTRRRRPVPNLGEIIPQEENFFQED